ncbi:MAG: hypothetical protein SGI73_10295 [Chloroflexota bacterium]|nr:hypothetical protein [Chloroflexota bacterium]
MIDLLIPWALVIALLYPIRQLERVFHQHIFKVGWLFTKNMRRTTIIYYCLFAPGVALNQFVYWLTAGFLNVRAERAFTWPETQEMAELKLNFVKLARGVGSIKLAIISIAPLFVAIAVITVIANNILNVSEFVALVSATAAPTPLGSLNTSDPAVTLGVAFEHLFAIPDLWLWLYLIVTIANTMMPDGKSLRGWRPILLGVVVVVGVIYALGVGDTIMISLLGGSLAQVLSGLGLTFAVIIIVDLIAIGVLGGIESIYERITGDSATFQNGKLIAMRRDEILKLRQQQREKEEKQAKQEAARAAVTSIYDLPLPIPPGPGRLSASQDESPEPAEAEPV